MLTLLSPKGQARCRALFTLLPARGSLQPLLPVAQAMRARGHDVALCSAPRLRNDVEAHGLTFLPAGLDWHVSDPDYTGVLCRAAGGLAFPPLAGEERFAWVIANLFGVRDGRFPWARFYLEPVQAGGADVNAAVRQHVRARRRVRARARPRAPGDDRRRKGHRHPRHPAGPGPGRTRPCGASADPRPSPGAAPGRPSCVEVVHGDVRDPGSVARALHGAGSAGYLRRARLRRSRRRLAGLGGPAGNARLIHAAARTGAAFVLVSVVGASPSHPIGLFRAKHAAEEALRASGLPWTIVRATAFMETWGQIMGRPLQTAGKILVFGRGDNPVNFLSATDVAALVEQAVTDPGQRSQILELSGPDNLTFNEFAVILQESTGCRGAVRHIPRPALRVMAGLTAAVKPALARQARAALAMDTIDMRFDPAATRRAFPNLPNTSIHSALKSLLA